MTTIKPASDQSIRKVVSAAEVKPIIDKIYGIDLVVWDTDLVEFGHDKKFIYCRVNSSLPVATVLELASFINDFHPNLYWVWAVKYSDVGKMVEKSGSEYIYEHTFKHPARGK